MALTINPAVGRARHHWIGHSLVFGLFVVVGALMALAVVLAATSGLSALSTELAAAVVLGGMLWATAHDLGFPTYLPYRQGQVPEILRELLPPSVVAAVYGVMLGFGFLTFFTYAVQLAVLLVLPYVSGTAEVMAIAAFALGKVVVLGTTIGATSVDMVGRRFHWTRRGAIVLRFSSALVSITL